MNYHENEELWLQRVEDFQANGLTQMSWCQKHDIKITALRYCLRKLREEESTGNTPEWVQLKVALLFLLNSPEKIKITYLYSVDFFISIDYL